LRGSRPASDVFVCPITANDKQELIGRYGGKTLPLDDDDLVPTWMMLGDKGAEGLVGLYPIAAGRSGVRWCGHESYIDNSCSSSRFRGGGFYLGGPAIGGGGLGLILLVCIVIYLMGGFR